MKDANGALIVGHPNTDQYVPVARAVIARYGADDPVIRYAFALCTPHDLRTLARNKHDGQFYQQLSREWYGVIVPAWRERGCDPPDLPLPAAVADLVAPATAPRRRASARAKPSLGSRASART